MGKFYWIKKATLKKYTNVEQWVCDVKLMPNNKTTTKAPPKEKINQPHG